MASSQVGVPCTAPKLTWCPTRLIQSALTNRLRSNPPQPLDDVKKYILMFFNLLYHQITTFCQGGWSTR